MLRSRSASFIAPLALAALAACADPVEPDPMRTDAGFRDAGRERDAGEEETDRDAGPDRDGGVDRDGGERDGGVVRDGGPERDGGPRVVEIEVAYTAGVNEPLLAELYLTESSTTRYRVTPQLAGGPYTGGKGEPTFAGVDSFQWTPDRQIVYRAQQDTYDVIELYLASDPKAGAVSKLSNTTTDVEVYDADIGPGGQWLTFSQAVPPDFGSKRHVVRLQAGATPTQISVGSYGTTFWSPSGTGVAFQDIIVSANDRDLWFVDLDVVPFASTRLHPGANLGFSGSAAWSSDGTQLVFSADETALRLFELYRVTFTGNVPGPAERLLAPFPVDADVIGLGTIKFAPSGDYFAFMADLDTDNVTDLYVVDTTQTVPITPVRLTAPFPKGSRGVDRFEWSRTGTAIVYAADYDIASRYDLYVTGINGPSGTRINVPVTDNTLSVDHERFIRGDTAILYTRYDNGERRVKLVELPPTPGTPPIDLGPIHPFFPRGLLELSPSEDRMIHMVGDDPVELYLTDLTTATPTTTAVITSIVNESFNLEPLWCWDEDDTLVVIRADGHLGLVEDFSSSETFQVSGPLAAGGRVKACAFPPPKNVD